MLRFFILGIYLLRLFGDGVWVGWNRFLHGGSIEDEDDSSILTDMTTWSLLFLDSDIKAEMMSLPEIIFSSLFSVLSWLDLATMKD
jgi:hypothetical protein